MSIIDNMMKDSFMNMLYIFPIYTLIPILAITMDVDLLHISSGLNKDKYSPNFQLVVGVLQLVLCLIFKNSKALEEKDLLKYMVMTITALSIGHQATTDNNTITKNISKTIDLISTTFLKIDIQILLILSPVIMMFFVLLLYMFNPDLENTISKTIQLSAILIVLILVLLLFEILKGMSSNFNEGLKELIEKNKSFIFYFKWFLNVLIYTSPLIIVSIIQKDITLWNVFKEIFNKYFLSMMGMLAILLPLLEKVNILNETEHSNLVSFLIICALTLSNYKTF
jgi:hypothetical protein